MKIDPTDIAQLRDDDVKRLALIGAEVAELGGPLSTFWTEFSHAAIRAVRERRLALAHLEQSFLDDDAEAVGSLVGPDDDPIGDAQRALRDSVKGVKVRWESSE